MLSRVLFIILQLLLTSAAFAEVWSHVPQRTWDSQWEQRYSDWVAKEVDTEWLKKPQSPFYKWHIDCADLVYLSRLYFSYQNQLEFKINDPEKMNNHFISSRSGEWDHEINPQVRMQKFARFVLKITNTYTLVNDSTLTKISAENIRPGAILLADKKRQHSYLIKSIRPSGIPLLLFATLPGSEFLYESFVFPASENIFPSGRTPSESEGGVRRWKWPQDLTKPLSQIPYHDDEQTRFNYSNFFDIVMGRLRIQERNNSEHFQYMLEEACMKVRVRVNVIIDAGHAQQRLQGRAFSTEEIDLYSTYKRDRDIAKTFEALDQFYLFNQGQISNHLKQQYQSILEPQQNSMDYCWVQWANNRVEPLGLLRQRFLDQRISSDPSSSFAQRWGE